MANPFDQFDVVQAPVLRPDPIPRPEAIERPGGPPTQRRASPPAKRTAPVNPFDQFDPPPQTKQPPEAVGGAEEPVNPRFGFTANIDMEAARAALDAAPPELRAKILKEWEATQSPPRAKAEDISTPEDMAKSFGTGLIKGTAGMASLPNTLGQLITKGADYVGLPEWVGQGAGQGVTRALSMGMPVTPSYDQTIQMVEGATGPLYKPKTTAGQYSQTVGEFVPGGFTPGGVLRKAANVVVPAVTSETAGQMAEGTGYEQAARVAGAVTGSMLPNVARRVVSPFPNVQPERARQVAVLEREGVPLTAGDRTGSKPLRYAESVANDVPFSGHRIGAQKELQGEQFTRAVLRRAGIDAPRATDDVIDAAYRRLGQEFETIAQATAVPVTPQLTNRLNNIVRSYERITEPSLLNPLPRRIADDIMNAYRTAGTVLPRYIDGQRYMGWRSDIGQAARAAGDPRTERALYAIQHELDQAAENLLRSRRGWQNNALADRMREARREYRNLITISKARGAGEDAAQGIIKPNQLQQAAKQMEGFQGFSRGRGDFTDLAKSGVSVLTPLPNSGTPARLAAMSMLTAPATAAGMVAGGPVSGVIAGAGSALSQGLMARMLMSRPVQSYLGNQTMARAAQNSRAQTPIALGALPLTIPRD